jgi:UDP-glucose:(heptosyl)LPS alpha-1,3-glucosyltransferase
MELSKHVNIALIIEHFDPNRGGAEHFTVWLAAQLAARGCRVDVVCHDSTRPRHKFQAAHHGASHDAKRSATAHGPTELELPDEIQIHRHSGIKLSTGIGFRQFGEQARRWCREHRPDAVHSMTVAFPGDIYQPHAGVYARIQAQAIASRETPAAANWKRLMLGFSGKQRTLLNLEKRAVKTSEAGGPWKILCLTPMMLRDLREIYNAEERQLVVMENPMMYSAPTQEDLVRMRGWFRQTYGLSEQDKVAVFVGHDFRRKGLAWAIRAVAQTSRQWKLIVAGLGRVRKYLELAKSLGVEDRVKFIGPTQQMDCVYSAGDALILPTFYDSFGLAALEALAFGLPVISTRFLGAGHFISETGLGVIVEDPRNTVEMAAGLDWVDQGLSTRMARAMRAVAITSHLSGQRYMDRLMDLYRECMLSKAGDKRPGDA